MSEKGGFFFNTLTGNLKWNSRVSEEVVANKMHITRLISYKLRLTGAQQNNLPGTRLPLLPTAIVTPEPEPGSSYSFPGTGAQLELPFGIHDDEWLSENNFSGCDERRKRVGTGQELIQDTCSVVGYILKALLHLQSSYTHSIYSPAFTHLSF